MNSFPTCLESKDHSDIFSFKKNPIKFEKCYNQLIDYYKLFGSKLYLQDKAQLFDSLCSFWENCCAPVPL